MYLFKYKSNGINHYINGIRSIFCDTFFYIVFMVACIHQIISKISL